MRDQKKMLLKTQTVIKSKQESMKKKMKIIQVMFLQIFVRQCEIIISFYKIKREQQEMERPRESKLGQNMYQQVLTRNFEVIQRFLSQFHSIYQKQDEYQVGLVKLEHKISMLQKNNKKLEQTLIKYSDVSQKKMNSLKEFVLQKLKMMSQKVIVENVVEEKNRGLEEGRMRERQEVHQIVYKYDEHVNQQIKKMEWQITSINQRISSITVLANSIDQKVGNSVRINKNVSEAQFIGVMKQYEYRVNQEIQELKRRVGRVESQGREMNRVQKMLGNKICEYDMKLDEIGNKLDDKVNVSEFGDFKEIYKDQQGSIVQEISQTFSNKRQTSKSLNLLQKKLLKLEMIEEILKQNQENNQPRMTVNTSMYQFKPKSPSIHTHKRFAKSIAPANNSMLIRKVNAKSKIFEDRM